MIISTILTIHTMPLHVNTKQAGIFADWYGRGGGGADCAPLCNSCLNGPIDLKFGMYIVLGKISRYREKIPKKLP